jgi:Uri superfamily endonuclease
VKGNYILLLELAESQTITVGKAGTTGFSRGYYAYVGSAMNGLEGRVKRHLRKEKKRHWHIDYLLDKAVVRDVITCPAERKIECDVTRILERLYSPVPGFGASDCRCGQPPFLQQRRDEGGNRGGAGGSGSPWRKVYIKWR